MDSAEAPSGETAEADADESDAEQASDARRAPSAAAAPRRAGRTTGCTTAAATKSVAAENLCDPEELDRLRAYLDKQLQNLSSDRGPPRQSAAAPADGAAEPLLGVRP